MKVRLEHKRLNQLFPRLPFFPQTLFSRVRASKMIMSVTAMLMPLCVATAHASLTVDSVNERTLAASSLETSAKKTVSIEGLELLERMSERPDVLSVYQVVRPESQGFERRVALGKTLASMNGIDFDVSEALESDARGKMDGLRLRRKADASAVFEVNALSGNFIFNGGLSHYRKEMATEGLPSDEMLQEKALQLLKQLDLSVKASEMVLAHVGGVNMGVHDGAGGTEIFEKFKTIRFERQIEGLPVTGDSRLLFQFGRAGAPASMVYQWPTLQVSDRLTGDDLREVSLMQKTAVARLEEMAQKAERSVLKTVDLVVYDDGQGHLEPAYHVVMARYFDYGDRELTMIPYDFYVPLSQNPRASFPDDVMAPAPTAEGGQSKNKDDE